MSQPMPSIANLKAQAKRLRAQLESLGTSISHSKSLELIAQQQGCHDWNTLCAKVDVQPLLPANVGDRVTGRYLSIPFSGSVRGLEVLKAGRFRISIEFDHAIDVVRFDSFSALRKRVDCVIDASGKSYEKTSDGQPHLVLENNLVRRTID